MDILNSLYGPSDNEYDKTKCNYEYIQTTLKTSTWEEKCNLIAKGFCNTKNHFINPYKVYYCLMSKQSYTNALFVVLTALSLILIFLYMNHIRRRYFTRPLLNLRSILGISGPMAEVTILPIIYSITPLLIRLQGATHNLDFTFNMGGNLGTLFTFLTFSVGLCSMIIGKSAQVNSMDFLVNIVFMILSLGVCFLMAYFKKADYSEGILLVFLYIVYLTLRWCISGTTKKGNFFLILKKCLTQLISK